MNKSPLNYLVTVALGAILWVIFAIFYGGNFSQSLILAEATPEEFLANLRIILGVAVAIGIINCIIWYYFGDKPSTAGNLGKAKRVWWGSFILQIVFSLVLLLILVFMYLNEGILTKDWIITFIMISLLTWIFFWFCTFMFSPRAVKYIPLFK